MRKPRVEPRLKFLPMMLAQFAWWGLYLTIAYHHTTFVMLATVPWMLFSAAFTECAIGNQVLTAWPKK